ncbi:hypothetical protein H0H93_001093 [Arthromyces matolae]|nr:hypothetical protein H0H93_001093 [Arthromyces matolae]
MPTGTKRSASLSGSDRETRPSKVAKTEGPKLNNKILKKRAKNVGKKLRFMMWINALTIATHFSMFFQRCITVEEFYSSATPLHVNITGTPSNIADRELSEPIVHGADAGIALVPSTFSTGSLGWKGSKRITVELHSEGGEKEKVEVMLSINAVVLGSKPAKPDKGDNVDKTDDSNPEE